MSRSDNIPATSYWARKKLNLKPMQKQVLRVVLFGMN